MRSLIIGAGGFVGRHLVAHLRDCGDEVYCGVQQGGSGLAAAYDHELELDITQPASLNRALIQANPDVVYHLAGIAFVPEAEEDFERTLKINVAGTANVVKGCIEQLSGRAKLIFVSSAEVYGAVKLSELPITENTPVNPSNNYSLSKRMAEMVVERRLRSGEVAAAIARPFNHIGPGQDSRFVSASFALQLARIAHGMAPAVMQVGNLSARRDFSDVRDIVRGYRALACGDYLGIYNLGSGVARPVQRVLDTLISISGVYVDVQLDPNRLRGSEASELYGSYGLIHSKSGWEPKISFERSLEDVYRYWFDRVAEGLLKV
jgi:GDP-4-dehydro-6-deoxy-D-mannose reductase